MRFTRTQHGLEPFDDAATAFVATIDGEPVEVDIAIVSPRDLVHKFQMQNALEACAKALHMTPARLRAELLIATGHFVLITDDKDHNTKVVAIEAACSCFRRDDTLRAFWADAVTHIQALMINMNETDRKRVAKAIGLQEA